ncbi:hypothetical protein F4808DRAFT_436421 [Astrocystis sublimbata]|nr:hypothetical protein F4808DRAFT_436421 [Astrocystis sublimbata]
MATPIEDVLRDTYHMTYEKVFRQDATGRIEESINGKFRDAKSQPTDNGPRGSGARTLDSVGLIIFGWFENLGRLLSTRWRSHDLHMA